MDHVGWGVLDLVVTRLGMEAGYYFPLWRPEKEFAHARAPFKWNARAPGGPGRPVSGRGSREARLQDVRGSGEVRTAWRQHPDRFENRV